MIKRPLLVGITGGIGAGKSTVCKVFQILGVPAYNADSRAKWIMNHDSKLIGEIQSSFGKETYIDGKLNREFLATQVFNSSQKLSKLNSLVHPKVGDDFAQWVINNNKNTYLIKEAALLIESGSYKELDKLIVVEAPRSVRVSRVLARDSFRTEKELNAIIEHQLSDAERSALASFIIVNDEKTSIVHQIIYLNKTLLQVANVISK